MASFENEKFMRAAIELAEDGLKSLRGGPFGAVVVKDGKVVGRGQNQVTTLNDPTAHAEVQAIRDACKNLNTFTLIECEIYSSCEPCPMCLSAIYWARLDRLYYAATQNDASHIGFDDSLIYTELRKSINERTLKAQQLLREEALKSLKEWANLENKIKY